MTTQCQQIAEKLAALEIYWTGYQRSEQIKHLKTKYQKTRNQNCTAFNLPTSCPPSEEFDQVLSNVPSREPAVVRNDQVS
ncbi:unnamed protein product [Caretta caretta]